MSALSATGKDAPVYAVSAIPENMKTGMYAVIREKELRFEINSTKMHNVWAYRYYDTESKCAWLRKKSPVFTISSGL